MNPFVGDSVAARYASARPALHDRAIDVLRSRLPEPARALDLGCGTGLSTRALSTFARTVVGVDVSADMLHHRDRDSPVSYVRAAAERLPFDDRAFDLVTVASALHWFEEEAEAEIARVLRRPGWFAIYEVSFRGTMTDVPEFEAWSREGLPARYPHLPRRAFDRERLSRGEFTHLWREDLDIPFGMPLDGLVEYLMTHSERVMAAKTGRETEQEQRRLLRDRLDGFYRDATSRELWFRIWIEAFARTAQRF